MHPCEAIGSSGKTDARTSESLAVQRSFFKINPDMREFLIVLNVTNKIHNGQRQGAHKGKTNLWRDARMRPVWNANKSSNLSSPLFRYVYSSGVAYMRITVNSPPENGTCTFLYEIFKFFFF